MFTNHPILDIFDYFCVRNAQCWARITKSDMEIQRYNRLGHTVPVAWNKLSDKAKDLLNERSHRASPLLLPGRVVPINK